MLFLSVLTAVREKYTKIYLWSKSLFQRNKLHILQIIFQVFFLSTIVGGEWSFHIEKKNA